MMTNLNIAQQRLHNQHIAGTPFAHAQDVVRWLGALQAQDYLGALWAVGLRMADASETAIEQAIAAGKLIRTWPMRGTLHLVAPADVRWMLALLTPRVLANSARRHAQLDLDDATLGRAKELFAKALEGGKQLTRPEMMSVLEQAGLTTAGQRGYHLLGWAAQSGLICFGPPQGKQQTFVLLDEWAPATQTLTRDEALATLAIRYFTSHGPATVQDLMWWSGLAAADAKAALALAKPALTEEKTDGQIYWRPPTLPEGAGQPPATYLLPGFDEYLLGYTDRRAVLDPQYSQRIQPGKNGIFSPTVVVDGQVVGTWQRALKKASVVITARPFSAFSSDQKAAIALAAEGYGRFLGRSVTVGF